MLHLISVTRKSKVLFNVGGDNQHPRFHIWDCDGNFETGKIIDGAAALEMKIESYTLSAAKDFIHAMATMIAAQLTMYSVLHMYQKRLVQCILCKSICWGWMMKRTVQAKC